MNISFELYKYYFYVCEFKSITKAANYLFISQPAISKQIKQLENKLGKKLINKTKNGIELTNDGEQLYKDIKDSIERLNLIESKYNEKSIKYTTTIKIIAGHLTTKNILLDTIVKINEIYPTIKFEITTHTYDEAIVLLHQGKCDLIFFCLSEVKEVPSNICMKKIVDINDIFVVGNKLKDSIPLEMTINQMNNYPIICKKYIKDYYDSLNINFKPTYLLSDNWLVEEYAKRNLGIGVVTKEFLKNELNSGILTEIEVDYPLPPKEMGYAYRNDSLNIDIIKEITKQLAEDINMAK